MELLYSVYIILRQDGGSITTCTFLTVSSYTIKNGKYHLFTVFNIVLLVPCLLSGPVFSFSPIFKDKRI